MTIPAAPRRLALPILSTLLLALGLVAVPSTPALAVTTQGISGHVTASGGAPLAGIDVFFIQELPGGGEDSDPSPVVTDASGAYSATLPVGSYVVAFYDESGDHVTEYYNDATSFADATPVPVSDGNETEDIDAELADAGHITGHVQAADGTPIADAFVDGYVQDNGQWVYSDTVGAFTDDNGDYDISAPAGTYRLEFSAQGYASEFYDDAQSVEEADDVTVDGGDHKALADVVLDAGASISGNVTFPAGVDPDITQDGLVTAYDTSTGKLAGFTWVDTSAGSGSTHPYTLDSLRAGSYRIEFTGEDGPAISEAQYFDSHPESAGPGSADPVDVTPDSPATGIDATLDAGGTISGRVVDGDQNAVAGCDVVAFSDDGTLSKRVGTTDENGSFVVTGLTTADYHLEVGDFYESGDTPCSTPEYYTNANGDLSPSQDGALSVSAKPGTDQHLTPDLVYGGTVAPQPQPVVNTAPPTVPAAAPVVGTPVTADPGQWDPANPSLAYQWRADGTPITGATAQSYTPVPGDVGKTLSVVVSATAEGFDPASATSNSTAPVVAPSPSGTILNGVAPAISGIPRVGQELSAYAGYWYAGSGDPTTTLQWLRDGTPIPGATGPTYLLVAADRGTRISLRVTATKDGYQPSQQTSAPTAPVAAGILTLTDVPRLLGVLKVGKVLHAVAPSCTPEATGATYQWLRNGVPIKGPRAKKASYTLVAADRGKRISVRISVLRPGYAPTVAVARKLGKVR